MKQKLILNKCTPTALFSKLNILRQGNFYKSRIADISEFALNNMSCLVTESIKLSSYIACRFFQGRIQGVDQGDWSPPKISFLKLS